MKCEMQPHIHTPLSVLPSCLNGTILSRGWLTVAGDCLFGCLHCQQTHKHRVNKPCALTNTRTHSNWMAPHQMFPKMDMSGEGMTHTSVCRHCSHWEFDHDLEVWPVQHALWRRISHILLEMDNLNTLHSLDVKTVKWEKKNTSMNALIIAQCPVELFWD